MVFCNTKACVEDVGRVARQDGLKVAVLHSGKSQDARDKALADFKSGRVAILVATDVAGRGIDVADVSLVVNYELPSEVSQYVHRIGRTGRAGKAGVAISFISSADSAIVPELRALLQRAGQAVPPELRRVEKISAGL
jgi:ATP-dependent RNA helicase DDX23/PRP28